MRIVKTKSRYKLLYPSTIKRYPYTLEENDGTFLKQLTSRNAYALHKELEIKLYGFKKIPEIKPRKRIVKKRIKGKKIFPDFIPPVMKLINGREYYKIRAHRTKAEAQKTANYYGKDEISVRIINYPSNKRHRYAVYTRRGIYKKKKKGKR